MDKIIALFLTAKRADGIAVSTTRDYVRALARFVLTFDSLDGLSRESVRQYVANMRDDTGWADSTCGIHLRYVLAFLRWLHVEGYTADNLAATIKAPRRAVRWDELLTSHEINALLAAANQGKYPERDNAIILFLLDTGIRRGEFVLLQRDQLRTRGARMYLQFEAPKTGDKRYAILCPVTTQAMRAYLAIRADNDPALWYGEQGPYQYHAMYRMLRRHAKTAGIAPERVHPHVFRKIFATRWIRKGGDEQRLMSLGGWRGAEMLRIYVQLGDIDALLDGHAAYSPVAGLFED